MERKRHLRLPLAFLGPMILMAPFCNGAELPAKPLAGLAGSRFSEREAAQEELLEWARRQKKPPLEEFLQRSRTAPDPEVRERCRAILLLLLEDEYLRVGEGYLGVAMQDEMVMRPGLEDRVAAVRVVRVEQGSPAACAGLEANDLIVGMIGVEWGDSAGLSALQEQIRKSKPGEAVKLEILRAGRVKVSTVVLGRLAPGAAAIGADGRSLEPHEAIQEAKSRFSRRWLENHSRSPG